MKVHDENPVQIRPVPAAGGEELLLPFLLLCVNWSMDRPPLDAEAVRASPELFAYVEGWGRDGDLGLLAQAAEGEPVGAAWLRLPGGRPGYGWVADDIPELSIAVVPQAQGAGLGGSLLRGLIQMARMSGVRAISLSVEETNGAVHLYAQHGFVTVGRTGSSDIMLLDLARDPRDGHAAGV